MTVYQKQLEINLQSKQSFGESHLKMSAQNLTDELDLLDEDFIRYLDLSKCFLETVKSQEDRQIVGHYIRKCCSIDTRNVETKIQRNLFFKYFLKMLQTSSTNQLPQYDNFLKPQLNQTKDTKHMSPDERIYVAAKLIPGHGSLIYMAVSNQPELGWINRGLEN